ncbi:MAG: NUDIX hydrolase [Clostridiales bacterium]|nr:NUDIX hydrolase [Clostridiales bacterium]
MNLKEETLSQDYKYQGRIINLRVDDIRLPNGNPAKREVVEHPGGVCVAALTDDMEVLMVRQFRYPYQEVVLEVPAGKRERGEDPLICGKRELREETGAVAQTYTFMGELYPSPGYCGEVIYLYLATDLTFEAMDPDEDEFLEPERIPLSRLVEMTLSGEIKDAKTQALILKIETLRAAGRLPGREK